MAKKEDKILLDDEWNKNIEKAIANASKKKPATKKPTTKKKVKRTKRK